MREYVSDSCESRVPQNLGFDFAKIGSSVNWQKLIKSITFNPDLCTGGDLGALAALGTTSLGKLVHEQLALQLTLSRDSTREAVTDCSWFFFELMIKAMVEHLATANTLHAPRKHRWDI